MSRVDDLASKVKAAFLSILDTKDERLSKSEITAIVGEESYPLVRDALLATEKVESLSGRTGGLSIRATQGNRREWTQAADTKARKHLQEQLDDGGSNDLIDRLVKRYGPFSDDEADTSGKQPAPPSRSEGEAAVRSLKQINKRWPQHRIAEALSVSQATVSNWLSNDAVNPKYSEAVQRLAETLAHDDKQDPVSPDSSSGQTEYGEWLRVELNKQQLNAVQLAERSGVHVNTILNLLEGRTERPQKRTREQIEKALKLPSSTREGPGTDEAWYYIGLPWTREEIEQVPEEPGVYIIHDKLGRPAYVGVAHKGAGGIRSRLKKHEEMRWTSDRRVANSFSYALAQRMPTADPSEIAKSLEKLLIKFMGNAILINERDVEDLQER